MATVNATANLLNISVSICGVGQQIRRLQVPQSLIQPVLDLHEQIVATFFDDMAILYNDDAIHLADRGKTMRNGDYGSADYELGERILNVDLGFGIQTARRFIEHKKGRIHKNGPGDSNALTLAA